VVASVTDRLRAAVLTLAVPVVAAMLAACGSGDGEAQDATSSSGGSSGGSTSTGEQRVGLELSVGECLADLGSEGTAADGSGAGDPSAAPSAPSTTAQSTTTSTTTSAAPTAVAATSSSTSSAAVPTKASEIDTVDCDRKHVGEVFAQKDLDDVLFPGQGPTQKRAADLCTGDGFTDFTGSEFDSSALDVVTYVPSKESWAAKDRTVSCVVTDPDGPTTGSLRDSYR
jgi:hypothetical protein